MKSWIIKSLLVSLCFSFTGLFSQQRIKGKVMSENDMVITSVLVVNVSNGKSVYNDSSGEFMIEGSGNDELRFIKKGYERVVRKVYGTDIPVNVILQRIPEEIEEVEILKLTGDLKKDSKRLTKEDKVAKLQKDIGLPRPPEVMREKAPELKDVLLSIGTVLTFDIDAIYKLISGDARRMKNLYKYEDSQRNMKWIIDRTDAQYFLDQGIPEGKIKEFIQYAFTENPHILPFVKKKNIDGALFEMEKTIPKYVERLKVKNP
ncbi:hypothetical protein HNP38_001729 [Chryseobacterium defluvii]|uniref:Carboxypeptidase-like protein n=1 Tax=Chryseobacterium defluvii TaxID=160396 RepID=A0A840KFX4_9FLAO|nr:carboxypeptidase regulatory-like domain-containing protein [Chryseobacterium defluvii]MBB4806433.1 hypothetical protein [Chryseobacterium defluvii]